MGIDFDWLGTKVFNHVLTVEEQLNLSFISEETFKRGDSILTDGQEGGTLYFIRSGKASVLDYNRYEGRVSIATLEESDLIGEMSFFKNRPVSAEVKADEDCTLYKMVKSDMAVLMREHEAMAFIVMQTILNHEGKIIVSRGRSLAPLLRQITEKASGLPWAIKAIPIAFAAIYTLSLVYASFD